MMPGSRTAYKESETLNQKTILIRAVVTHKNDQILTVKLEDGGGNAEVVIREDHAIADPNRPAD